MATPTTAPKPVALLGMRTYLWEGHRILVRRAGSNNPAMERDTPSCDTCSLPYAISEAVDYMNRFQVFHLVVNDQIIDQLV